MNQETNVAFSFSFSSASSLQIKSVLCDFCVILLFLFENCDDFLRSNKHRVCFTCNSLKKKTFFKNSTRRQWHRPNPHHAQHQNARHGATNNSNSNSNPSQPNRPNQTALGPKVATTHSKRRHSDINYVILDAGAFIGRQSFFNNFSPNVTYYMTPAVNSEIRDKHSRQFLQNFPYEIIVKKPDPQSSSFGVFSHLF